MKKMDSQGRVQIPRELLNLAGFTFPADLLLIKKSENLLYLVESNDPYKYNKKIVNQLHIDEKGRIILKSYMKNSNKDFEKTYFEISVIITKKQKNRIAIELVQ